MDDNNSSISSCGARVHEYKNGKTFEECKEEAESTLTVG